MKQNSILFLFILISLFSQSAFSAELTYKTLQRDDQSFENILQVTCQDSESNYCLYMCGNKKYCERSELSCMNCAGDRDFFLRILFTKIKDNYSPLSFKWPFGYMMTYLADGYYILADYKSIYNYYKKWGSEEVQENFKGFCSEQSKDPIFVISLNEKNKPDELIGVICSDPDGQSYLRMVEDKNNPEYSSHYPFGMKNPRLLEKAKPADQENTFTQAHTSSSETPHAGNDDKKESQSEGATFANNPSGTMVQHAGKASPYRAIVTAAGVQYVRNHNQGASDRSPVTQSLNSKNLNSKSRSDIINNNNPYRGRRNNETSSTIRCNPTLGLTVRGDLC